MLAERFQLGDVDFFDVREVRNLRVADDHLLGDAPPQADHLDFGRVRAVGAARRGGGRDLAAQMHVDVGMRDAAVRAAALNVLQIDVQLARPPPHGRAGLRRRRRGASSGGHVARCTSGTVAGESDSGDVRHAVAPFAQSSADLDRLADSLRRRRRRSIEAHQLRADGNRFAHLAVRAHDAADHAAGNRDRRLVGHHVDQAADRRGLLRPGVTCQATISASTTPSPRSGSLNTTFCMAILRDSRRSLVRSMPHQRRYAAVRAHRMRSARGSACIATPAHAERACPSP